MQETQIVNPRQNSLTALVAADLPLRNSEPAAEPWGAQADEAVQRLSEMVGVIAGIFAALIGKSRTDIFSRKAR